MHLDYHAAGGLQRDRLRQAARIRAVNHAPRRGLARPAQPVPAGFLLRAGRVLHLRSAAPRP